MAEHYGQMGPDFRTCAFCIQEYQAHPSLGLFSLQNRLEME